MAPPPTLRKTSRMLKKSVSEAAADESTGGVAPGYVEDAFEARTKLAAFFSILLDGVLKGRLSPDRLGQDSTALQLLKNPMSRLIKVCRARQHYIRIGRGFFRNLAHMHGNDRDRMDKRPDRLGRLNIGHAEGIRRRHHDQPRIDEQSRHLAIATSHLCRLTSLSLGEVRIKPTAEVPSVE